MLRHRSAVLSALLLLLTPALVSAGDDQFADIVIERTELGPGLWMVTGAGGNMLLVAGSESALLVDDQFAPLTDRILAEVGAATDRPLRWIVNTHWHGDHTGGNENLGATGVVIVAHEGVRQRMSTGQFMAIWDREVPAAPTVALPVVTFNHSVSLHLGVHTVEVVHVEPAHTDGDSLVLVLDANVLHMGDTFFNGLYPFIDTGSGGNLDGMIAAAHRGLQLAGGDTTIVPGHGPLADFGALKRYIAMLEGVRDAIRPMVDAGKTREQVIAAKPTKQWDKEWGNGFLSPDMFVGIVVDGMKR